jgi:hypothetical protein
MEEEKFKVCFITAFEASYNVFERLFPKLQINCFIRKPISIDKLVEAVKTKLKITNNSCEGLFLRYGILIYTHLTVVQIISLY